jgi:glycosyltransferase involved in cell wall biosynthesis
MSTVPLKDLRVALVHHWLVGTRGGEKVLEAFCRIFPGADIYALVCEPAAISETIKQHCVTTSWIQKLPRASQYYSHYLPLFPFAIEQFDLSGYDLVISSDAVVSKGVITRPETCHICYCHTPMRYAWSAYHTYLRSIESSWKRKLVPFFMNYLRTWDLASSSRVDYFLANSQTVANRIAKYYRRDASVIFPPVAVSSFSVAQPIDDYFLAVGQLVPYKRFDLAIEVFNQLKHPLVIVGEGPEYSKLKRAAGENVRFVGRLSDAELNRSLSRCRALVFPGEEDFGLVVVEAHACGRPVIALSRGGALETVVPEVNGLLFAEETVQSLAAAVQRFVSIESEFQPQLIRETAAPFDENRFSAEVTTFISDKTEEHRRRFKIEPRRWKPASPDPRG